MSRPRLRWERYYFGHGDERWTLYRGDRKLAGIMRYRPKGWGGEWCAYLCLPEDGRRREIEPIVARYPFSAGCGKARRLSQRLTRGMR